MRKVTEFTIKRSKWDTGNGEARLLGENLKMCCLGFYMKEFGYTDNEILFIGHPSSLPLSPSWLQKSAQHLPSVGVKNSNLEDYIVRLNDTPNLTKEEREEKIAEIFKIYGITVNFVD